MSHLLVPVVDMFNFGETTLPVVTASLVAISREGRRASTRHYYYCLSMDHPN